MTTKTRDEAIEEIKKGIAYDVMRGKLVKNYTERDSSVCYEYVNGDGNGLIVTTIKFTPPKPKFKKGTIGIDEHTSICFYKELNISGNYAVCSHEKNVNETGGYTAGTFTPIYQTDPIEKLAFEKMSKVLETYPQQKNTKAHFKSKAKEELSK